MGGDVRDSNAVISKCANCGVDIVRYMGSLYHHPKSKEELDLVVKCGRPIISECSDCETVNIVSCRTCVRFMGGK